MEHKGKAFLRVLILFIGFSFVLSTSRSLYSIKHELTLVQDLHLQQDWDTYKIEKWSEDGEMYMMEGRMDMESTDYPGTGANNHHDPKTPGRL